MTKSSLTLVLHSPLLLRGQCLVPTVPVMPCLATPPEWSQNMQSMTETFCLILELLTSYQHAPVSSDISIAVESSPSFQMRADNFVCNYNNCLNKDCHNSTNNKYFITKLWSNSFLFLQPCFKGNTPNKTYTFITYFEGNCFVHCRHQSSVQKAI